jgi:beclin 1
MQPFVPSKADLRYASSDLSGILQNRRFNTALIALLDCLRQLVEFGKKNNRDWGKGNVE